MSVEDVLASGRAAAQARMADACRVEAVASQRGPLDPVTGTYGPPARTLVWAGPCRVPPVRLQAQAVQAGEQEVDITSREVHLPVAGTEAVGKDHEVTITASESDAALVGQVFVVRGPSPASQSTARKLQVRAVI